MGLLDQLALRAAGVAGSYQQAKHKGAQERYEREQTETSRQDALQRQALQEALLQKREARDAVNDEQRRRLQDAQIQDYEAQVAGTGRYAPKPVAPPKTQRRFETGADGTVYAIDEETLQATPVQGVKKRVPGSGGGVKPPKGLPASAVRDVNEWKSLRDSAREAVDAFKAIPKGQNVSGAVAGRVAGVLGQLGIGTGEKGLNSPTAIGARSKLSNIATALGKLRSGGAITPQEYERLAGMIPNPNEDEAVVRSKLDALDQYLERTLGRNLDTFEQTGYDVSGVRDGLGHAGAPTTSGPDYDAQAKAILAKRRGRP